MPRVTRYDDYEHAGAQARQLRAALDAIAEGYDAFATLDRRDRAMRELWAMGASKEALATFTGMSSGAIARIVRGSRPAGRGTRSHVSALLLTLAELS